MASLSTLYIKKETLQTLINVLDKKNQAGIELTISISDELNQHEQNLASFVSQSKEDREAKKPRFYVGNGKVFWTDGIIKVLKTEKDPIGAAPKLDDINDLPF
jgi:hypothetical protein